MKVTGEQPDEEIHRARFRGVPSASGSVPMEVGYITVPVGAIANPEAL